MQKSSYGAIVINYSSTKDTMENGQFHSNQDAREVEEVNGMTSKTDVVMSSVGEFGRWQALVTFLVSLTKIPVAWFQLGIVFLAPPLTSPPICARPNGVNITLEQWKNISQPPIDKGNTILYDGCFRYDLNYSEILCNGWNESFQPPISTPVIPCKSWEYDNSVFKETIITEWDLICDRTQLTNMVQMTFMFGVLIGNILFGIWADRIGRKRPLFFATIFQAIAALAAAVVPWYEGFVILRFLLAICTGGTMITSFVICMEIVGGWWRTAIPILYQVPFGLGQILMSVLAYYIREWRHLQITLALASALFVGCWWVVPESPRWLLTVGRRKKAFKILEKAAKKNGRSTKVLNNLMLENELQIKEQSDKKVKPERVGVIKLLQVPFLRRITTCIFIAWFIGGISFFGFSQYLAYIGGSVFMNIALSATLGLPGTIFSIYVVQKFGRKKTLIATQLITGFATFLILAFPIGAYVGDWPRLTMAIMGIMSSSITFSTLYLYSAELFPTVVRNSAMGIASMFARIGSMGAPFIATLGIYAEYYPPLIFGGLSIGGAFLFLSLPETIGKQLPDTIEDGEKYFKGPTTQDKRTAIYKNISQEVEDNKGSSG